MFITVGIGNKVYECIKPLFDKYIGYIDFLSFRDWYTMETDDCRDHGTIVSEMLVYKYTRY